jgi:hypothetical protein
MTSAFSRAKVYLDKIPGAVSGAGGHDQTFTAACCLVRFGLSEAEQWELLLDYNSRCSPNWSEAELRHKLQDAQKRASHGELLTSGTKRPAAAPKPEHWRPLAPVGPSKPPAQAAHTLPSASCPDVPGTDLPEPIKHGAAELLRALYKPEECVRIVRGVIREGEDRETPEDAGAALPVREWLAKAEARKGDLASLWCSSSGAGVYVGMNPVTPGGSRDSDVTAYRFALVESDSIPQEEQFAKIHASKVPCAAIIDSGGKSIHAWIRVDAKDAREYAERVAFLHGYFPFADRKNVNPARLSRLPDARRKGNRQKLLNLNIGAASWAEWMVEITKQALGPARSFTDLCLLDTTSDPNCVIGFRDGKTLRYLCRGKSAWLLGPSGVGKSSLVTQFAVGWAIGAPVFGITPARPLKSLIVQAENDDYDLAEMVQGVAHAHGIHPEDPRWLDLQRNVLFRSETSSFGPLFCRKLRDMLDADRPDVVWVDPLLSFAGIDVSKQDQVTPFLRGELAPVIESLGTVLIGVHHTGKPKDSKVTRDWTAIDWAYAGLGSSELVNWARAVMNLRPVEGRTFELKLAKRGSRAGATHPDGAPAVSSVWIRQATGRIYWEHVDPPQEPAEGEDTGRGSASPQTGSQGAGNGRRGAPAKADVATSWDWLAMTSQLPPDGVTGREFVRRSLEWMSGEGRRLSRETILDVAARLVGTHRLATDGAKFYPPKQGQNPPQI